MVDDLEGAIDIAAEPLVYPWDVAPVQVIVEEAGGRVTDLNGLGHYRVLNALSTNGQMHEDVLSLLAVHNQAREQWHTNHG